MTEQLTITTMGKQRLRDLLKDRIWAALYNLPVDCNDEVRSEHAVSAVMVAGEYAEYSDHGAWKDKDTHQ